jgi:hypothetical protein
MVLGRELINPSGRTVYESPLLVRKRPSVAATQHRYAPIATLASITTSNARLSAHRAQMARIALDAEVAGQLAHDATTAFERGAAVAPCHNRNVVEPDGVEAIGAQPHVALEIGLPLRADAYGPR